MIAKKIAKRLIPGRMRRAIRVAMNSDPYERSSYAQEGEDLILLRLLGWRTSGFYVDVGAHDPRRYSNTYLFYLIGWSGINIDPRPGCMAEFDRLRPRDRNLELAISDCPGTYTYYEFDAPELNGFSKVPLVPEADRDRYPVRSERQVQARRLRDVLDEHVPAGTQIDFLSVDVEGHDLEVLRSNDWSRFRPRAVITEAAGMSLEQVASAPVGELMGNQGYVLVSKAVNSIIFMERDAWVRQWADLGQDSQ